MNLLAQFGDTWGWLAGAGVALVVLGVFPGLILRVIARAWPKNDPRRKEMIGELYGVPWAERPLWVGEQIERMFTEGLPARFQKKSLAPAVTYTRTTFRRFGELGRAHGLKGKVKVHVSGESGTLSTGSVLFLSGTDPLTVEHVQPLGDTKLLVRFEGFASRADVLLLGRGALWIVAPEPPAATESWSTHELVGMRVERDGAVFGTVIGLTETHGVTFVEIDVKYARNGVKNIMLPFTSTTFPEVRTAEGVLVLGKNDARRLTRHVYR